MEADRTALKKRLKEAGLSDPLIEAAWPAAAGPTLHTKAQRS